jgi:hypothetical protein
LIDAKSIAARGIAQITVLVIQFGRYEQIEFRQTEITDVFVPDVPGIS